jgi:hypothetical protein
MQETKNVCAVWQKYKVFIIIYYKVCVGVVYFASTLNIASIPKISFAV